jgi:hypothetical protein
VKRFLSLFLFFVFFSFSFNLTNGFYFALVAAQTSCQGCCSFHGGAVQSYDYVNRRVVCNDGQYSPTCTEPCSDSGQDSSAISALVGLIAIAAMTDGNLASYNRIAKRIQLFGREGTQSARFKANIGDYDLRENKCGANLPAIAHLETYGQVSAQDQKSISLYSIYNKDTDAAVGIVKTYYDGSAELYDQGLTTLLGLGKFDAAKKFKKIKFYYPNSPTYCSFSYIFRSDERTKNESRQKKTKKKN